MSRVRDFFVLDLETGGLSPDKHAICSVCAIILDGITLAEKARYYTLVRDNPERIVTDDALAINGLTREELQGGELIDDVLITLKMLLGSNVFVAQNAAFDAMFLNRRGFNITDAVDTMEISRSKYPGLSARLGDICTRLGIEVKNAHNAAADVEMTCKVLSRYKELGYALDERPIRFKFK